MKPIYRSEPAWEVRGPNWNWVVIPNPLVMDTDFITSIAKSGYLALHDREFGLDTGFQCHLFIADRDKDTAEYPFVLVITMIFGPQQDMFFLFPVDIPSMLHLLHNMATIAQSFNMQSRGMQNLLTMGEEWRERREKQYKDFLQVFEEDQ